MKLPLQITTRKLSLPKNAIDIIKQKASKLETFYDKIIGCRVMVETPHKHKNQGVLYNVRIVISVPGSELIVKREPNQGIYIAIRDAFDAARRQIQNFARKRRGEIKTHNVVPTATITEIYPYMGYGFMTTDDGRQIYFHTNSLIDQDIAEVEIGASVRFAEKQGMDGPQASTVALI